MIRQFKPALLFLAKFLGIYVLGNLLYGFFISYFLPQADPATHWVSQQVADILTAWGNKVITFVNVNARVSLMEVATNNVVINVFEGCNGINVMVVLVAFLVAYQGTLKRTIVYSLAGIIIIHISNLARLLILFHQAKIDSPYFYYFHKYLFTAVIYFVVLLLWVGWVWKFNGKQNDHTSEAAMA